MINTYSDKVTYNSGKLFRLLWINVLIKALDISTTIYSVQQNGIKAEVNPFMKMIIDIIGFYPAMAVAMLAHCAIVYFLYRKARVGLLKVVGVFTLVFVILNIIDILIPYLG